MCRNLVARHRYDRTVFLSESCIARAHGGSGYRRQAAWDLGECDLPRRLYATCSQIAGRRTSLDGSEFPARARCTSCGFFRESRNDSDRRDLCGGWRARVAHCRVQQRRLFQSRAHSGTRGRTLRRNPGLARRAARRQFARRGRALHALAAVDWRQDRNFLISQWMPRAHQPKPHVTANNSTYTRKLAMRAPPKLMFLQERRLSMRPSSGVVLRSQALCRLNKKAGIAAGFLRRR